MFESRNILKKWICVKCGNINSTENSFCEFCGNAKSTISTETIQKKVSDVTKLVSKRISDIAGRCICGKCGSVCKTENAFCVMCGAPLKKSDSDSTPMQEIVPIEKPQHKQIICIHCGAENQEELRFCSNCDKEIRVNEKEHSVQADKVFCPECGSIQSSGTNFCNDCGARIEITNQLSR